MWADVGNPRVNQLGYLPEGVKIASFKTSEARPQRWELKSGIIARGKTSKAQVDAASGDRLQQIDFSAVNTKGSGFTITVGTHSSYPFTISPKVFHAPLYDALKYFYHNRSGIAIDAQYTAGPHNSFASDAKWARPVGHVNLGPNKGDRHVPC